MAGEPQRPPSPSLHQLRNPITITRREQLTYAIRFVVCMLTMETVLHTMYVVAIKDTAAWDDDTAAELSMIGFWNLVVVWLKVGPVMAGCCVHHDR